MDIVNTFLSKILVIEHKAQLKEGKHFKGNSNQYSNKLMVFKTDEQRIKIS